MSVKILKKKNYLTMIENGAKGQNWMFRNFYIERDGVAMDSLEDGKNSCAVFVSSILVLTNDFFGWIHGPHATVRSTEEDMLRSGWYEINDLRLGSILIWEKKEGHDGKMHNHIGFYMGNDEAISNDSKVTGFPRRHHYTSDNTRKIEKIYWHSGLDED